MEDIRWSRVVKCGAAGSAAAALLWFVLRAYTGVYLILNLRVLVGVCVLAVPMLAVVYGFDPDSFKSANGRPPTKPVCAAASAFAVSAILLGELAASVATGAPIPWDKFIFICLGVAAVIPFQLPQVFKKS